MADKKISALTAASTPLTGSEVLPIVQGGSTVKVSVDNLTAGKAVSASSLTLSGGTVNTIPFLNASKAVTTSSALQFDGVNIGLGLTPSASVLRSIESGFGVFIGRDASNIVHNAYYASSGWSYISSTFASQALQDNGEHVWYTAASGTAGNLISFNERMKLTEPGNLTLNTGNVVIGTAGKGIDFSANGGDVLSQYDEGTYTPVFTASSSNPTVTYGLQRGKYVRVGNVVTVSAFISWSAISGGSGDLRISLPFAGESSVGASGAGPISSLDGFTFAAGRTFCSFQPQANVLYGNLPQTGSGVSSSNTTIAQMASSGLIIFSCTYLV